jgi:aspartyl-tRNA(Asn)/glutamyl-tRNA(Gln) amidotransferase subunit A
MPPVRQAWQHVLSYLAKQGHTLHLVSLPTTRLALSAYYILAPAEASSNLAKYDGVRYGSRVSGPDRGSGPDGALYAKTRGDGFGPEVKRRIVLGSFSLSADAIDNYFIQSQRIRRCVQADFDRVFHAKNVLAASALSASVPDHAATTPSSDSLVDVLITPTAPSLPPTLSSLLDESHGLSSPLDAYVNDVFTVPASLAGLPAISVPVSLSSTTTDATTTHEPNGAETHHVGIQVIGQYGDDQLVLRIGELIEHVSLE